MVRKINKRKYEYLREALKNLSDENLLQGVRAFTIFSEALLNGVKK